MKHVDDTEYEPADLKSATQLAPESEAEKAFSALVSRTQALCAAECDIAGLSTWDPAFDDWFREAEAARAAVVLAAEAVVMAMSLTAIDRSFRIVARNFESMLVAQDAARYAFVAEAMKTNSCFYSAPGRGPRTARATALLQEFWHYLRLLLSLPDYTPEPPCAPMMMMAA